MSQPETIGRYRVLGELGRGAMGVVYRARDESLDREVAIKVMTRGIADPSARARFQREARAAAKLQHPNIVVIYELGDHEGVPFMALELLEGMDLQRAIEGGIRPDPRVTVPIVLQLLAGLGHAHGHGIVHRDVKPSNVFLPISRPAKIMDFGVARLAGVGTTTTGAVSGTPSYMSPEQVSGGEVDGRSDLFSAGLILYELVTGERAIQGESVVALMYKILHETADLSLIPEEAPWRRLHNVLQRSLARRPEDRYPDAASMSTDLAAALSDLGGTIDWTAPADQAVLISRRPVAALGTTVGRAPETPRGKRRPAAITPAPQAATRRRWPLLMAGLAGLLAVAALAIGVRAILSPGVGPTLKPANEPRASEPLRPPTTTEASPPRVPAAPAVGRSPAGGPAPSTPATPPPSPGATRPSTTEGQATPVGTAEAVTASAVPSVATPLPGPAAAAVMPEARLQRAREAWQRGRWVEALAEARGVLEALPRNAEATALAQRAEAEIVVEECLRNAGAALRQGDRERAIEEIRRGFLIRPNDPRLLELHRQAVQQ